MSWLIRKLLGFPLIVLAAGLILFEDLVWSKIAALMAVVARWRLVQRLEGWILTRSRHTTLALFAVPIACLIPIKLTAVYFIARGHVITGIAVIVVAKLLGTAVSARLFMIAKPKLMTFETFVVVYQKAVQFKNWAHQVMDQLQIGPTVQRLRSRLKALRQTGGSSAASPLLLRLRAARRLLRRSS